MGKLLNELNNQAKTCYKKEAENCLLIYNTILETTEHVWESDWKPLTSVWFEGKYPNSKRFYKPSSLGLIFLKGIEKLKD